MDLISSNVVRWLMELTIFVATEPLPPPPRLSVTHPHLPITPLESAPQYFIQIRRGRRR